LDNNIIYNEDCIEGIYKHIDENSIDLIVTSPPYNCGIEYDSYDDNKPWYEYGAWTMEWLEACYYALKPDGRICVNVLLDMGNTRIGRFSPYNLIYDCMAEIGFNHHGVALWTDNHRVKYTAWGSWQSPSAPYIYCPYEVITIAYKNVWKKETTGEATILKEEFMEGCSGIWNMSTEHNREYTVAFPEELPRRCINLLTWKGDVVLDPFMGSGTTAVASLKTERKYIGFEISENYWNIANKRIASVQRSLF